MSVLHLYIILLFNIILKFKRTVFIWNINICDIINGFSVTFDQFNASLLNKCWFKQIYKTKCNGFVGCVSVCVPAALPQMCVCVS